MPAIPTISLKGDGNSWDSKWDGIMPAFSKDCCEPDEASHELANSAQQS